MDIEHYIEQAVVVDLRGFGMVCILHSVIDIFLWLKPACMKLSLSQVIANVMSGINVSGQAARSIRILNQ